MIDNFLTVGQQVLILFVLIGVGVICAKAHILSQAAVKSCAEMVMLFVTPCVIVQSFMRKFDISMLAGLGIAALVALLSQVGGIVIARLVFQDANEARRHVLRFGTVFSNAGYMAIPLQQALLGDIGVFYGAAYIMVFNLLMWSYGLAEMNNEKKSLSPRELIINPGVIGMVVGLSVFLFSIPVPKVIAAPIGHLAALNTPLPMLIIGYYLADTHLLAAIKDKRSYVAIFLRLLVIPLLTFGGMVAFGIKGPLLVACVVAASAPSAAATTMFATKYGQDTTLSVNMVSLSTLISMITMPLVVGLAQMMA